MPELEIARWRWRSRGEKRADDLGRTCQVHGAADSDVYYVRRTQGCVRAYVHACVGGWRWAAPAHSARHGGCVLFAAAAQRRHGHTHTVTCRL